MASSRDIGEWARQIYGQSCPNTILDSKATDTPPMLPSASLELKIATQVQRAILASRKNQEQTSSATTSSSNHQDQAALQTPNEPLPASITQTPVAWSNTVHAAERSNGEAIAFDGHVFISNLHPTISDATTTPPANSNASGLDFDPGTPQSLSMDAGYIADDEGSDISYIASDFEPKSPESLPMNTGHITDDEGSDMSYFASDLDDSESEALQAPAITATFTAQDWANNWTRIPNLEFHLEELEKLVKHKIQRCQDSVGSDCFPAIYRNIDEEQKRRLFYWRFGPNSYMVKYLQSSYKGALFSDFPVCYT